MLNGQWTDFVTDFMSFTDGAVTPDIHRRWCAISAMAGALERRVWAPVGDLKTYPNLYVILVAPPGLGKYIIESVRDLWRDVAEDENGKPAFHTAPDSVSRASLIDDLARSHQTRITQDGVFNYHSLLVAAEEFEVLLPSYEPLFIATLNSIFNNKPFHHETRRHGPAKEVKIDNPQLNILGGATPAYFTAHFPEEAWNTGLIRRIILVFSGESQIKDIFTPNPSKTEYREVLLHRLRQASALYGPATWAPDAFQHLREWHLADGPPKPDHSRLSNYVRTRTEFVVKLSLISGICRLGIPRIEMPDVQRAKAWLFEAESFMPDIFRAMVGKSDAQLIEELHYYTHSIWLRQKQQPLHTTELLKFLSARAPSDKIDKILEVSERTNVIARVAGTSDLWVPRPKHLHGVE